MQHRELLRYSAAQFDLNQAGLNSLGQWRDQTLGAGSQSISESCQKVRERWRRRLSSGLSAICNDLFTVPVCLVEEGTKPKRETLNLLFYPVLRSFALGDAQKNEIMGTSSQNEFLLANGRRYA